MLITRKIGKIIRGNATSSQLILASILGAILGFIPEFGKAPGLTVFTILLLLILNANLGFAFFIFGLSRILLFLFVPAIFKTGVFFIENIKWLFSYLINAPVFALFGFEYYLTTGGVIWGIVLGLIFGFLMSYIVKSYRKSMAGKEKNDSRVSVFLNSKPGKFLVSILIGSEKNIDYEKVLKKKSFPLRIWGIVVAVIFFLLLIVAQNFFAGNFIKKQIKFLLEEANGATVDIGRAYIDLKAGEFIVTNLAICDPEKPEENLFEADKIVADISALKLLSKRIHFDRVEIKGARIGSKRKKKGKVFRPIEVKVSRKPASNALEYYVANAEELKKKLKKVKYWYKLISKQKRYINLFTYESWEEKLEREAKELGYQNVKAKHLVRKAPTLVIANFKADKVKTYGILKEETLNINMTNISTNPELMNSPPIIIIKSSGNTLFFKAELGYLQSKVGINRLKYRINKIKTDKMLEVVKLKNQSIVKGGTVSIKGDGYILHRKDIDLDLFLYITIENSTVNLPEIGTQKIDSLTLPVSIGGRMDNPTIKLYTQDALKQLKDIIKKELKKSYNEKKKKVKEKYLKKLDKKLKKKKILKLII